MNIVLISLRDSLASINSNTYAVSSEEYVRRFEEVRNAGRQRRRRRRRRRAASANNESDLLRNVQSTTGSRSQQTQRHDSEPTSQAEAEAMKSQIRSWPHHLSFMFAALSCTIGMFSISRFAVLTIEFGAVFLVQFVFLSLVFGIPLLMFFASLGQYLGSGVIDMWRISPIFQGVGVALMLAQGVYSVYNIAVVSWMFIYFRDSFITNYDRYRWTNCFHQNEYSRNCQVNGQVNASSSSNDGWRIEQTIPDYFSGSVLLRTSPTYPHTFTGDLRFQTLFNIVVIWMAVFIGLSKGLKSYGKVVYLFGSVPLLGFLVFATKVIDVLPMSTFKLWLINTNWMDGGESWVCAARETFFTWGILGATVLQLASHNRFKHPLARDVTIVSIITLVVLVLSGIVGISTVSLVKSSGYNYVSSSFETIDSYEFLHRRDNTVRAMRGGREFQKFKRKDAPSEQEIIERFRQKILAKLKSESRVKRYIPDSRRWRSTQHVSFLAGVRILDPKRSATKYSGYQVMRLATELVPAYSAILGKMIQYKIFKKRSSFFYKIYSLVCF